MSETMEVILYVGGCLGVIGGGLLSGLTKFPLKILGIFICASGGVALYVFNADIFPDYPWLKTVYLVVLAVIIMGSIAIGHKSNE